MLSHLVFKIAFCLIALRPVFALTEFGVTYEFSGGRFGDCLLSYLHAKWIAYEKNIPLFYRPFAYSCQLALHEKELHYANLRSEPRVRVLFSNGSPNPRLPIPVLYICPYFPEDTWEQMGTRSDGGPWFFFHVDWKDSGFRKIAKEMISPLCPLALISPPSDSVNIALHFREGGGYDDESAHHGWPLKFPPLEFYVHSLLAVLEVCKQKPVYCFVFTDALEPEKIVSELKMSISPDMPVVFDYRKKNNSPRANVLEDFFSLFNFDILIRPQSNFSMVPSLIHDFALVYSPENFIRMDTIVQITKTRIERNDELLKRIVE